MPTCKKNKQKNKQIKALRQKVMEKAKSQLKTIKINFNKEKYVSHMFHITDLKVNFSSLNNFFLTKSIKNTCTCYSNLKILWS